MTNLPITEKFRITATFGQQGKYWKNGHKGVDIVADNKTIYGTCNGKVDYIGFDADGWGKYVKVIDVEGYTHIFCHLSYDSVKVIVGDKVTRETTIGTMGTTGNSTGVHLHYQINNPNGIAVNPCNFMGIPNEKGTYNSADYQIAEPPHWVEDNKGWKFIKADESISTNEWIKDSKGWCYVGADGYCVKDSWQKDNVGWCYLESDFHAVRSMWKQIDSRWYYFDAECHAVKGMKVIDGKHFYFAEEKTAKLDECQLVITNNNGEIL